MDIIRTVYYIHSPWRSKKNFCCFICVSYGPYTLLQNDSFFYNYLAIAEMRSNDDDDDDDDDNNDNNNNINNNTILIRTL